MVRIEFQGCPEIGNGLVALTDRRVNPPPDCEMFGVAGSKRNPLLRIGQAQRILAFLVIDIGAIGVGIRVLSEGGRLANWQAGAGREWKQ